MLGHSSTAITEQVYTSVFEDVEREAAESAAALVPRSLRVPTSDAKVPTMCPPAGSVGARGAAPRERSQVNRGGAVQRRLRVDASPSVDP
jgi:hypothetical protein